MSNSANIPQKIDRAEYERVKRERSKHGPQCPICKKPMDFYVGNPEEPKRWRCSARSETKCTGQRDVSRKYLELWEKENSFSP